VLPCPRAAAADRPGQHAGRYRRGRSTVRKSQGIEFECYTWPERFLVLTTGFDFQAEWDCSFRNYFADPDEWVNLFKVAGDDGRGRWRAVFATTWDESDSDALSSATAARRLNNPIGGLGMNCGIHDAVELADALTAVDRGADSTRLDVYEARRRPLNIEFIQQQTIANKKRLEEKDVAQRAARAADLAATAADPARHREFLLRSSLLASVAKAKTLV
jgi:3-(3-hydroxy-phenyl)propionate hydroxylase